MAQTVYGVERVGDGKSFKTIATFTSAAEVLDYIEDFVPVDTSCRIIYPCYDDLPAIIENQDGIAFAQFIGLYQAVKYLDRMMEDDPSIADNYRVIYSARP